jgi:hypothetical protein
MKKPKEAKRRSFFKLSYFLIILFLIIVITPLIFSYTSYPSFFPKNLSFFVDRSIAQAGFLPKNNRQIFLLAFEKTRNLNSYGVKVDLQLKKKDVEVVFASLNGQIEKAGGFQSRYYTDFTFPNKRTLSSSFSEEEDNFYLNVRQPLILPGLAIPQAKKVWYQVSTSDLKKSLQINLREDNEIIDDINKNFEKNKDKLIGIVNKQKVVTKEKIDNEETYKIDLPIGEKLLKSLISSAVEIKKPNLIVWVRKEKGTLKKFKLEGKVDLPLEDFKESELVLDYEISDFKKIENFHTGIRLTSPVELWLAMNANDNDNSAEALFAAAQNAKDFGQSFLALERMIKAIFLLPKAI